MDATGRSRRGRKPTGRARHDRLWIRMSPEEQARVEALARLNQHPTVADFLRTAIDNVALECGADPVFSSPR